jgi:general stress protein 26
MEIFMANLTLQDISRKMADIDFTMMFTKAEGGELAGRPMSNNADVEYDGDSWYFTFEDTRTVEDIERDPKVGLSLQGSGGILGGPGIMIAIEATAELIRDKAQFEAHWHKDLDRWFKDGIDTPGIVLIKAVAKRVHYWDDEEEGEVKL